MLYATIFHSLAAVVTGSVFRIRTLILMLGIVLIEAAILSRMGVRFAGLWVIANLTVVQVGYFGGVMARQVLEQAGYSIPPVRARSHK